MGYLKKKKIFVFKLFDIVSTIVEAPVVVGHQLLYPCIVE
jgi:hypothetical protein